LIGLHQGILYKFIFLRANTLLFCISFYRVFSLSKVYYNQRHIVASFALCSIYVRGQESVKHALTNFGELYFSLHLDVYVINYLLIRFCLKDTITTEKREVSFVRDRMRLYVGHRRDGLVFEANSWVLFMCDVTNSARKVQVSVDSTLVVDSGSSFINPLPLFFQLRFVIEGHSHSFTTLS